MYDWHWLCVGLAGTCFADFGNTVVCVDRDIYKIKKLILVVGNI